MNKQATTRQMNYELKCEKIFDSINLDEFIAYYNKHTDKEIKDKFNLTKNQLARYVSINHITKTERRKYLSRKTRLERYGDPTYRNVAKAKKTKLERYGDENYNNGKQISITSKSKSPEEKLEILEKQKRTCLEKFGVEFASQSSDFKSRMSKTCLQKYGVPYFCMSEKCRKTGFNDSSYNKWFEEVLVDNNIRYTREYWVHRFSYDFLLPDFNLLVEINPSPYHNSTYSPYGEPKDKYYHQHKSKVAYEAGYKCLHLFDWDLENISDIFNTIKYMADSSLEEIQEPNKWLYDIRNRQLVKEETDNTVIIFDDGFKYKRTTSSKTNS